MKPDGERHPVLRRQLRRLGLTEGSPPPDAATWQRILERVDRAYIESDQHRHLLERSLAVSSAEMQQLYDDLRASAEQLAANVQELARKNTELTKLDELRTAFISTA